MFSKARNGHHAAVEEALGNNFPVNSRDRFGNTMLMVLPTPPNICDPPPYACLHPLTCPLAPEVTAQNGNKKMAKLVLRHGADMNAQNNRGQAALHYCFAYGYHALGEYLVSKGCDPTIRNNDGLTCYDGLGRRNSAGEIQM